MPSLYSRMLEHVLLPAHNNARGRDFVRHRRFLEESQWWPLEKLLEFRWQETRALVEHTFRTVPYYQRKYAEAGIRLEDIRTPQDYARLPILRREEVNAHREELRSTAYRGRLISHATGGSSGVPTRFYITIESYDWRTACTERVYAYTGCRLGERTLFLWGAPVGKPPAWKAWKVKAFETFRRQLVINTFSQSEEKWREVLERARRYKPKLVVGYISSLEGFSRFLLDGKHDLPGVQAVIAAAEPLFPPTRTLVEKAFGAPLFNTYGSREFMSIAGECEKHAGMHVNCENIFLETAGPGPSDILVTDLHNYGMPFLRYSIGDIGVLDDSPCPCGRGMPRIVSIEGRVLDVLRSADGRVVPGELFPHVMKDIPEVLEFRVTQTSLTKLMVEAVLTADLSEKSKGILDSETLKAFGPQTQLEIRRVESIPLLKSGKRRVTIGLGG
jgi:phenylacetate-CoA ligase